MLIGTQIIELISNAYPTGLVSLLKPRAASNKQQTIVFIATESRNEICQRLRKAALKHRVEEASIS